MCLGIVVTAISAAGCAPAPDRARYSVEAYRQDPTLRRQELERCANDPGTLEHSADCVNGREADRAVGVGSLRDLPPLRLPPKK
ncbi:MAG TPA: EexN family lipoprotein [Solirubrobacteraceae bacterium]|nr:EexN family lipoprotein [Solirubrobacteraceae bacterium]